MNLTVVQRILFRPQPLLVLAAAALLLAGCGREQIRVYQVPREKDAASPVTAAPAGAPKLTWSFLPEGWVEQPVSGIRAATFQISGKAGGGAEVSVVALPGVSAAMTDIVNMWRQQIGLGPVEEGEVTKLVEKVAIGPGDGEMFDMAGPRQAPEADPDSRMLVAMAQDKGVSWFFKMTGDTGLIGEQRDSFLKFLESVQFEYSGASMASAAAPPMHGGGGGGAPAGKPHWTVPAGWTEAPPTSLGLAKFTIAGGDSGAAEVTVTVLPGAAGGTLPNVNRWRSQVGLSPLDEAGLAGVSTPIEEAGAGAMLVDMTGDQRVVGAMLTREGQSWFYKMTGDPSVVEREREAFVQFVKTVDYSHVH